MSLFPQHVAGRIRRYYNRTATVIYPPVDTEFFRPNGFPPGPYFLVVSALVPYKRVDLAIDACAAAGVPLRIVGDGPERGRLGAMAGPTVEFLGVRSDEEVRELYQGAAALLLPGEEDFGIAPVEAQSCGRPVVALSRGGARETVRHGTSGWLVDEPTPEAFATAIRRVTEQPLDGGVIRNDALRFSRRRYQDAMRACLEEIADAGGARVL